jgi:hypothetical protein
VEDLLDFALAADEGGVGVHFDEFLGEGLWDISLCSVSQCVCIEGTYSVRTSVSGGGEDHGKVENLSDRSMRHDVVLVQTWIPVSCDMVEADLDIEDEKNLVMDVSCGTIVFGISDTYGVVLVDTLPWNSFNMLAVIGERVGDHTVTADGVGEASSHEADCREEPHLDVRAQ